VRILAGLLVLIATAAAPPTSVELHARYGKPDVQRFAVRPDLALSVEYGEDGQACAMRIEPRHDFFHSSWNNPPTSIEALTDILNEVVPPETRGKELGPRPRISGACYGALGPTEYENVTINLYYGMCEKQLTPRGLEVHFKRPACKSFGPRRIPESR
jgi:hypothetical protein